MSTRERIERKLRAMSESEYAAFRGEYGGDQHKDRDRDIEQILDDNVNLRARVKICRLLGIPTPEER